MEHLTTVLHSWCLIFSPHLFFSVGLPMLFLFSLFCLQFFFFFLPKIYLLLFPLSCYIIFFQISLSFPFGSTAWKLYKWLPMFPLTAQSGILGINSTVYWLLLLFSHSLFCFWQCYIINILKFKDFWNSFPGYSSNVKWQK